MTQPRVKLKFSSNRPWKVGDYAALKWNNLVIFKGKINSVTFAFRTDDPYVTLVNSDGSIKTCLMSQIYPYWRTGCSLNQIKYDFNTICLEPKFRTVFSVFFWLGLFYSILLLALAYGPKK